MPRTLAQNAQYIAETIKPAIKTAIENKGVTVPSTDSFLDYADRIGEIEGGGSGYQLKDLPTGSISTVSDAAPLPLNALKVSVEAVQSGSGTPSPSNIRPISGWNTVTLTLTDEPVYIYGFHIDGNQSNPSSMVTYLADAVGKTPAHMDYTNDKFDYGSWGNAFFMPRPCILGQSGTVIKYLNPNDFTKDTDGNTVVIGSTLASANVMIEFPKIWYKVVPDVGDDASASVYISNRNYDGNYKDYAYIDYQGIHKDHFYMPAYNGSVVDGVMRSLSGMQVSKTLTGQQEINAAIANGNGWYTEDAGEIMLINFLLVLLGKSTDTQSVFGQGLHTGGTEAINDGFRTGIHNDKGMFYGTNSGAISSGNYTNAVKVFGIENYWGFQWRRYAGDMLVNGARLIKLCYGQEDGSTTDSFNSSGSGYVNIGATPSGTSSGYISKMKFDANGMYSSVSSGSASTYYCDGQWFKNSATCYAFRGGGSNDGSPVGAFCASLDTWFGLARWGRGACISYK